MANHLRGVQNLHTMAGRADGPVKPHKAYLRISCLEMEKARLNTEKAAARRRMEKINMRIQEIDAEEKTIFNSLPPGEIRPTASASRQEAQSQTAKGRGKRGMSFRY